MVMDEQLLSKQKELRAMSDIEGHLHRALPWLSSAASCYKQKLKDRKFSQKEIIQIEKAYDSALSVWSFMHRRFKREYQTFLKSGGERF